MVASFLSYIVQQHGLTFEDVATDALAHVLRNSASARKVFRQYLNEAVPHVLPEFFSIETRVGTQGLGIPDLILKDEAEMPCVIIEAKFTAALAKHQPVSYISYLRKMRDAERAALLLFLVPESKLAHYTNKARARCADEDVSWNSSDSEGSLLFVRFVSWNECLIALRSTESPTSEFGLFLRDLERMCMVAEPDQFEEIGAEELAILTARESRTASRTRNFMKLADEIAKRSFSNTQKVSDKYDNAWGSSWSGLYGKIADVEAWIGLDASAWSELGKSPIWLEIDGRGVHRIELRLKSLGRDVGYFMRKNGNQIAVPILLGPGSRDEVLERCCEQVAIVRNMVSNDAHSSQL